MKHNLLTGVAVVAALAFSAPFGPNRLIRPVATPWVRQVRTPADRD
jgi:hypothetical protein